MSGRGAYYKAKYGGGRSSRGSGGRPPQDDSSPQAESPDWEDRAIEPLFTGSGSIRVPYGPVRDISELRSKLHSLEGAGYGAYRDVERTSWSCMRGQGLVIIDRVQRDAYAAPSRVRVVVTGAKAALGEAAFESKAARVAAADWVTRRFFEEARRSGDDARTETGGWGGKKGGELRIVVPSQFVLERTSASVSSGGAVEARATAALPARGRSIEGRWAADILCNRLIALAERALCCNDEERGSLHAHVAGVLEQQHLRSQLPKNNLCAFVAEGCVLPRKSGNDDRPMTNGAPFKVDACGNLLVELEKRDGSRVRGLGLPARAVTLVCGGGFHGKSTLLQGLEVGCYDKVPGDGRELCLSVLDAAKIRAEDGRFVSSVDVSAFLGHLPGAGSVDARAFSTLDASGSTSQAAAISEALEVGSTALLFDEDTCATNFMIRDDRMRRLVADDREPITPLVDRVAHLAAAHGVASVLVVGGTGDFFKVADAVIVMDTFQPRDATQRAKALAADDTATPAPAPPHYFRRRAPAANFEPRGRVQTRTLRTFQYGDNNDVDLAALAQLVELGQTRAIAAALAALARQHPRQAHLDAILTDLDRRLDAADLDLLAPANGGLAGDLARPRKLEIAAAFNRLRSAQFKLLS